VDAVRSSLAAVAVALVFAGCRHAASPPPLDDFDAEWKRYLALPQFKAMAVAGDTSGAFVCGTSHGRSSWRDALADAYAECARRRTERAISAPCRPFAVNNAPTGRRENLPALPE